MDVGEVPVAPVCDPGTVTDAGVPASPAAAAAEGTDVAPAADVWVAPTWEQVVREHSARVYRLAYRLSGNAQDAEDLTQETFVRVFRSLANF